MTLKASIHEGFRGFAGTTKYEAQTDAWATQNDDGSWILDGIMPVNELKARLDIKELPSEDKNRYNTLAGLLMYVLGQLPTQGQVIELDGWRFKVVDLEGGRIDKVLVTQAQNT